VESFLDSHSREKYVYKSEMDLLLKVKRHVACKGINDIQIRKSTFALDKKLHRFFFFSIFLGVFLNQSLSLR
jgi:hypothetical protein